jgi:Domain of unknown function (DUF4372)
MRFTPSIFGKLLEPIKRRQFDRLVERHAGDAYVKSFTSWTHLLALVARCLFERRHIGAIDKPPPVNPSRPQCQNSQNQLSLSYA